MARLGAEPLRGAGLLGTCHAVCGLPGRELPDGYRYAPPVQLLYDIDASGP